MDRVSQLQDILDKTVQDFATALLEIQNNAPPVAVDPSIPVTFVSAEQIQAQSEAVQAIVENTIRSITTSSHQMGLLIESLPGIDLSHQDQFARLKALDEENKAADQALEDAVAEANLLMRQLQAGIGKST
ncbi:hypothetical protein DFJ77DRAFT_466604 [Powellomyces hirtus]|nr:hypothetical protein DFJ77DRAFT_466604 [Powellomyces hirtus]